MVMFRILVMLGALALASCGGGGGGGDTDAAGGGGAAAGGAAVSFDRLALSVTVFQNQQADVNAFITPPLTVEAAVSGALSGNVFAVVRDTGNVFATSAIEVQQSGPASFRATLHPNVTLPPGAYAGNLELHLCRDAGCAGEFPVSGAALPYHVTILPQMALTVLLNGTAVGTVHSGRVPLALSVPDGGTVELHSNVPATIQFSSGPGFVTVTVDRASTSTDWKAVLSLPAFASTNEVSLTAVPQDATLGTQMGASVDVTVVPRSAP